MKKEISQEDFNSLWGKLESKKKSHSYIRDRLKGRSKLREEKQDRGEDTFYWNGDSYNTKPEGKAQEIYFVAQNGDSKHSTTQKVMKNYDKADFEEAIVNELSKIRELGRHRVKNANKDERHKTIQELKNEIQKTETILSDPNVSEYFHVDGGEKNQYIDSLKERTYEGVQNAVESAKTYEDKKAGEELLKYVQSSKNLSPSKEKSGGLEKKIAGAFSIAALGVGAIISHNGITGNVVSQSTSAISGVGAFLVVIGIVLGIFSLKK